MSSPADTTVALPAAERVSELKTSLAEIRDRVKLASPDDSPVLVAVSKYKPAEDILACYQDGQLAFGENYVNELVEKAAMLPSDIQWHFIGSLQSNKCKTLAAIPSIYCIQTLDSAKKATALNKGILESRTTPLNVFIQVNTSGEDSKSGLAPLSSPSESASSEVVTLARHILSECPRLRLQGLMTIGSIEQSHSSDKENKDFQTLIETAEVLEGVLGENFPTEGQSKWGCESGDGKLELSMGMSADFEAAIKAGATTVRVGSSIFGTRKLKEEMK
ncbi:hypothetical protein DL93DRAFT_2105656 [Clavulina sp. PMI_390]|nr:hypothetical protein DL93DRAFT_2105656 [Clavulina sp. PMI_390]